MTKRDFWKYLTRVHKWAGLVLGIQVLIWFSSGFFMSFFDIDRIHGDFVALADDPAMGDISADDFQAMASTYKGAVSEAAIRRVGGETVYVVKGSAGTKVYDLQGKAMRPMPDKAAIIEAAKLYHFGDAAPVSARRLTEAPIEYRKELPVWQVQFDDKTKTRLYINADTAELMNVRTRLWRAFDFMWMLHIMDYKGRDDINNWWLWLAALMASLFALSGLSLVVHRIILRPRPQRKTSPQEK
jgi:hypothetical protein